MGREFCGVLKKKEEKKGENSKICNISLHTRWKKRDRNHWVPDKNVKIIVHYRIKCVYPIG